MNLEKKNLKFNPQKIKSFLLANDSVPFVRKIYAVLIAVGLGLLLGIVPISAIGGKPILAYELMFSNFEKGNSLERQLVTLIATYGLLALGTAIAFKAGVFNIGATGQFMAGGWLVLILGIEQGNNLTTAEAIPTMLVISFLGGACVAFLAAILKVLFRINEVVSTLLLNWIVFYVFKIVLNDIDKFKNPTNTNTSSIPSNFTFAIGSSDSPYNAYLIPLLVFLILVVVMWLVLTFTTFGFNVKACGRNIHAARANGINVNIVFISIFVISGGLCGLGGAIFYVFEQSADLSSNQLPLQGFNAIAISLLAFNEPFGVILSSLFFSILDVGKPAVGAANISPQSFTLVISIIIFFSALAAIFLKARPLKWIIEQVVIVTSKEYSQLTEESEKIQKNYKKNEIRLKYLKELKIVEKQLDDLKLDVKELSKQKSSLIKTRMKYLEKLRQFKNNKVWMWENLDSFTKLEKDFFKFKKLDFSDEKMVMKPIKQHPLIEKRKKILSLLAPFELPLESKNAEIKRAKKIIIKKWYKKLSGFKLFFMKVVA